MKNEASLPRLRQELRHKSAEELAAMCLRMARYKKENKELLHYLLFEAEDEFSYIRSVKEKTEKEFAALRAISGAYYVKKSVRRILSSLNKYIRYSGLPVTAVELLLHFCHQLRLSGIPYGSSRTLSNLYQAQLKKIEKHLDNLHEDLQYDYRKELAVLSG
jgi:membrane-anchored protein YejM (alkaline phosphatase superfamily)